MFTKSKHDTPQENQNVAEIGARCPQHLKLSDFVHKVFLGRHDDEASIAAPMANGHKHIFVSYASHFFLDRFDHHQIHPAHRGRRSPAFNPCV